MVPEPRIRPLFSPPWMLLHLTSLEAPLIAVLWAMALAKVNQQPFLPEFGMALFAVVWWIYLANEALAPAETRDPRHIVSRLPRPLWLLLMLTLASMGIGLALLHLPPAVLASGLQLTGLVAGYFGLYGNRWNGPLLAIALSSVLLPIVILWTLPNWVLQWMLLTGSLMVIAHVWRTRLWQSARQHLDKDLAGGLLFAMGCCLWSRFLRAGDDLRGDTVQWCLVGSLMVGNLSLLSGKSHQRRRWLNLGLGLSLLVLGTQSFDLLGRPQIRLAWASLMGVCLLWIVEKLGQNLSFDRRRIYADLAIAIPALLLGWLR